MIARREGGFLIAKIHHVAGRVFSRMLKAHGIEFNSAQGRILFALWQEDGVPIRELSKRTSLGKSTLTSMLDRLEAAGYIARERSATDRREVLIRRTTKDRETENVYRCVSAEMTDVFYAGLADAEITRFETTLEAILGNLSHYENGSVPAAISEPGEAS